MSSITFKGDVFGNIIDLLTNLLETCVIIFTKESIRIKTIDSSMVCLISVELNDIYTECKLKTEQEIGVSLVELAKIMSCKGKNDDCKIKFNGDDIQLIFTNENNKRGDKYKLKLLDLEGMDPGDPEIEPTTQMTLSSKYFAELCKKIQKFEDKKDGSLGISFEKLTSDVIFTTGSENMVELTLEKGEDKLESLKIEEDIKFRVLLRYILFFSKAEKFAEEVTLTIHKEDDEMSPLEVSYEFGESYIKFHTSPQIEDDD